MRGMIVIALLAALTMVAGGIIASQISGGGDASSNADSAQAAATSHAISNGATSTAGIQGGASTGQTPADPASGAGETPKPGAPVNAGDAPLPPLLPANQPVRGAPINGVQTVEDYYSDTEQIGNFVIAWRPGAFSEERREQVAAQSQVALDQVNQKLGTNDHRPIEILLADQMYLETDCHGCQGYAFSDFRQVFILQDGSMAEDEFQALLIHEIGHVVAGANIALPHVATLFLAEGLATWLMTPALMEQGYLEPRLIAAWAWKVGKVPSIWDLRKAKFEGRTGARHEYDPAASFTQFVIETYGMTAYKQIYAAELPDDVVRKGYEDLEQEWHAWLAEWADTTLPNGVNAEAWWAASDVVKQGFDRLYDDETTVTQQQYAQLATARVALNRGDVDAAIALMQASGLIFGTAH